MATTTDGALVEAARAGDQSAFGQLFDTWFDRVHDLSRRIVKDPGVASEVAQDAFLSAWTRLATLEDPDAFGGWLLRIARNGSLNRLAKERRSVALDDETMTTMTDNQAPDHDPLARMDQAAQIALVWDAAAALGERDLSILDLHLRHGLGAAELAEELGTTANNAHQVLFTLRKRLGTNVRALVLWRGGRPGCEGLKQTLLTAKVKGFDKQAVKVIDKHAQACDECSREREDRLSPSALFGAAPVVAAAFLFKAQAASALDAAGVPMGGSTALGGAAGSATGAGTGGGTAGGSSAATGAGPVAVGAAGAGGTGGAGAGAGTDPTLPGPDTASGGEDDDRRRPPARVLALALIVAALLLAGWLVLGPDDGEPTEVATVGTSTTLAGPATSTTAPRSSTTKAIATTTTGGGGLVVSPGETTPPTDTEPGPSPTGPVIIPTGPAPTQPPRTTPPATRPPATKPPATTTTAVPDLAPTIDGFTASYSGSQCRAGYGWILNWSTSGAYEVRVSWGQTTATGEPTGKTTLCIPVRPGTSPTFAIEAQGLGGQASATTTGSG